MRKITLAFLSAASLLGAAGAASAQPYYDPYDRPAYDYGPRYVDPDYQPWGPGYYAGARRGVSVPSGCYTSREQVRVNGRLVWRPVVTCPYDDSR